MSNYENYEKLALRAFNALILERVIEIPLSSLLSAMKRLDVNFDYADRYSTFKQFCENGLSDVFEVYFPKFRHCCIRRRSADISSDEISKDVRTIYNLQFVQRLFDLADQDLSGIVVLRRFRDYALKLGVPAFHIRDFASCIQNTNLSEYFEISRSHHEPFHFLKLKNRGRQDASDYPTSTSVESFHLSHGADIAIKAYEAVLAYSDEIILSGADKVVYLADFHRQIIALDGTFQYRSYGYESFDEFCRFELDSIFQLFEAESNNKFYLRRRNAPFKFDREVIIFKDNFDMSKIDEAFKSCCIKGHKIGYLSGFMFSIENLIPTFDCREYGHRSFRQFVEVELSDNYEIFSVNSMALVRPLWNLLRLATDAFENTSLFKAGKDVSLSELRKEIDKIDPGFTFEHSSFKAFCDIALVDSFETYFNHKSHCCIRRCPLRDEGIQDDDGPPIVVDDSLVVTQDASVGDEGLLLGIVHNVLVHQLGIVHNVLVHQDAPWDAVCHSAGEGISAQPGQQCAISAADSTEFTAAPCDFAAEFDSNVDFEDASIIHVINMSTLSCSCGKVYKEKSGLYKHRAKYAALN